MFLTPIVPHCSLPLSPLSSDGREFRCNCVCKWLGESNLIATNTRHHTLAVANNEFYDFSNEIVAIVFKAMEFKFMPGIENDMQGG